MLVHWVKVIWAKDGEFWTTQGWEINFFQTKHWHARTIVHPNVYVYYFWNKYAVCRVKKKKTKIRVKWSGAAGGWRNLKKREIAEWCKEWSRHLRRRKERDDRKDSGLVHNKFERPIFFSRLSEGSTSQCGIVQMWGWFWITKTCSLEAGAETQHPEALEVAHRLLIALLPQTCRKGERCTPGSHKNSYSK